MKIKRPSFFTTVVLILLLVVTGLWLSEKQNSKYTILYQYQAVPDVALQNTFSSSQGRVSGEVTGFVRFDSVVDQPRGARQYYSIKALNAFDSDSSQHFSIEEIVKLPYIPPKSLGVTEGTGTLSTDGTLVIDDGSGNLFIFNGRSREMLVRDSGGDKASLITNENDFQKFIVSWLGK